MNILIFDFQLGVAQIFFIKKYLFYKLNGDWGLGIGDWGLGIGPNPHPQSPIPNPQRHMFQT